MEEKRIEKSGAIFKREIVAGREACRLLVYVFCKDEVKCHSKLHWLRVATTKYFNLSLCLLYFPFGRSLIMYS